MNLLVSLAAQTPGSGFPPWVLLTVGCAFMLIGFVLEWGRRKKRTPNIVWPIVVFLVGGLALIVLAWWNW